MVQAIPALLLVATLVFIERGGGLTGKRIIRLGNEIVGISKRIQFVSLGGKGGSYKTGKKE